MRVSTRHLKRTVARAGVTLLGLSVLVLAAVPVAAASSHHAAPKPKIKTEEVGYFGSGLSTRQVIVIVYAVGPRARDQVTICLKDGRCKTARGHHAPAHSTLAWYTATFSTGLKTMQDRVTFTATATDAAGRARVTATKPVLCIKNDGSTPQS